MKSDLLYSGLNSAQLDAVRTTQGPLLIIAGAGTGKTKTLTLRVAELIRSGVAPENILAITFTNKAAGEMKDRIGQILKDHFNLSPYLVYDENGPFIGTFHSLGLKIIRENRSFFNLPARFSILDRRDSRQTIREALRKAGFSPKDFDAGKLLSIISRHKGEGLTARELADRPADSESTGTLGSVLPTIWQCYEELLTENRALDFDDLLLKPLQFLDHNPQAREQYRSRWQYVHIDEYQDTNEIQYRLSRQLAENHQNICVVGDPDQTIYTFRGAKIENILRFESDYPKARTITLAENYRSSQLILKAANEVISRNLERKEKNLFTNNPEGPKIRLLTGWSERNEADKVVSEVQHRLNSGLASQEIGVFFRANFQSRALEEAFLSAGIPYLVTGTRFFERKEVKDILAYLRAALSEERIGVNFKRIVNHPPRKIGKVSLLKILAGQSESLTGQTRDSFEAFNRLLTEFRLSAESLKPSELIKKIIKLSGLEHYWQKQRMTEELENGYELVSLAAQYDKQGGLEAFLDHVDLYSDQDALAGRRDGVRLMTVHAAKGLEFDCVFITGLEAGLFPHSGDESDRRKEEEERRLFYVAMTRARRELFLSFAYTRTIFGTQQVNTASEFLSEINPELIDQEEIVEAEDGPRQQIELL